MSERIGSVRSERMPDNTGQKQALSGSKDRQSPSANAVVAAVSSDGQEVDPIKGGCLSVTLKNSILKVSLDQETSDEIDRLLGSTSIDFQSYALGELATLLHQRGSDDITQPIRMALATLRGIAPRNESEALIALQMVYANHLAFEFSRRSLRASHLDHLTAYANCATKFQRTALAQVEALAKLRRDGRQVVEHVYVGEGGQAVFAGTIHQGGRGA